MRVPLPLRLSIFLGLLYFNNGKFISGLPAAYVFIFPSKSIAAMTLESGVFKYYDGKRNKIRWLKVNVTISNRWP